MLYKCLPFLSAVFVWGETSTATHHTAATAHSSHAALAHFGGSLSDTVIRKSMYSNSTRFVFVAGIEGTGHHLLAVLFKECYDLGLCIEDTRLESPIIPAKKNFSGGIFFVNGKEDLSTVERSRENFVNRLRAARNDHPERLIILNTLGIVMSSYPNFGGPDKVFKRPDLPVLAHLAEEAGVDLRVLVLTRSPKDILVSTTVHRKFGGMQEALVLADNAAVLAAQVQLVDPKFVMCAPFDRLVDGDWWSKGGAGSGGAMSPASFLHPQLNASLEAMLYKVSLSAKTHTSSRNSPQVNHTLSDDHDAVPSIFLNLLGRMTRVLEQAARCPV